MMFINCIQESMSVLVLVFMTIGLIWKTHGIDVKIGGIFGINEYLNSSDNTDFMAFSIAVDMINAQERRSGRFGFTMLKETAFVDVEDDLGNMEKAMQLVDRGCAALIGPIDITNVKAIQELCSKLQTPQLIPFASGLTLYNPCNFEYLLRMSPDDELLLQAVADVVGYFKWIRLSILASRDSEGRSGIATFRQTLQQRNVKLLRYEYFHVDPRVIRFSLRRILAWIKELESRVVVLKSTAKHVGIVMEEAAKMNMVDNWVWILVDNQLDEAHLLTQGGTPIGLQGVIGIRQSVGQGRYSDIINNYCKENHHNLPKKPSAGRIIDSVLLFAEAVRNSLKDGVKISSTTTERLCDTTERKPTNQGSILSRYLRKVRIDGFMDRIALSEEGATTKGIYDVVNLYNNKVTKVGQWSSDDKLVMYKNKTIRWGRDGRLETPRDSVNVLANKTITIVTFKSPPFIIPARPNITEMQSPDDFKGAVIDLLNSLKETLHFDYVIYMSPDRTVGNEKGTGVWGGVIGQIMRKKADLAIGPITITSHRSKVVHFTHPFMTSGFGVVMATKEVSQDYFGFLKPFHKELWVAIIGSVVGMAVVSWLFSVLSPNGFYGRCEQGLKTEVKASHRETKNNLRLSNALWSSAAYFLGQGPDGLHPVSSSGRAAIAVWWFCITILASTYTANLAAYLTTNRMQTPISTVQDLSQQNEIDYGLVGGSQTQEFFEDSHVSRYQIMWEYMRLRRAVVSNYSTGIKRVLKGNYAFIHDAPVLQYSARKQYCGQMKLIGGFDHGTIGQMSYGFALRKNSPFKTLLNVEILKKQHSGEIKRMIKKWMVDNTPCLPLDDLKNKPEAGSDTSRMGVMNMLGVFFVMIAGVVVGFVLLILEWFSAAIGDYSTGGVPLSKALRCRVQRLLKHIKNPQAVKLERKCEVPFTDNKATQTTSPQNIADQNSPYYARRMKQNHNSQTSHLLGESPYSGRKRVIFKEKPHSTAFSRQNGQLYAMREKLMDSATNSLVSKKKLLLSNPNSSKRGSIKV